MSSYEGFEKNHISVGPWGGQCGTRWDDGVYCTVRQIVISHGAGIVSIHIEYDTRGCSVWSEKHGGNYGGHETDKIKLDYPEEYLISMSGYYGNISECGSVVVRSLLFESNRKRYGPFGIQKGTQFMFPITGGKVVGFHGRSGVDHLESVGVYVKPLLQRCSLVASNSVSHNASSNGASGKGFLVAVREKMDNYMASRGFSHEYERKEKVSTTTDAAKRSSYQNQRHIPREKEDYHVSVPNYAFSEEAKTNDRVFVTNYGSVPHVKGEHSNMRQRIKENEDYMFASEYSEFETNDRAYTTAADHAAKEYSSARHMAVIDQNEEYMVIPNHGFSEFEPKNNIKVYGSSGTANGYYSNIRQLGDQNSMYNITNRASFGEFETNDKLHEVYGGAQNTKGSTNVVRHAVSYGPWGGNGGMLFDDGMYTGVREIHLARSGGVVSIRVCYDMNGQAIWGNKNGGTGGFRLDKITLDYPHEFLTHISGYYGAMILRGPTVVKSLTFYTNKRKYGPFGDEQGIPFSSPSKGGNNNIVVGFHGGKGWFLDCIGVHVVEWKHSIARPLYDAFNMSDMRIWEQVVSTGSPVPAKGAINPCGDLVTGMLKEATPRGTGPWGGDGGKPWDDGVFTGIKKIFLTKGEALYSIQIEYDLNGQSVWSAKHGRGNEGTCHVIQFEYPNEVLTCISGYYGCVAGDEGKKAIKSLTFHTNRGRYGPYGEEAGTYFTSTTTKTTEGKIVGFHGRSACFLYALGIHMQHYWLKDGAEQHGPIKTIFNKLIFA